MRPLYLLALGFLLCEAHIGQAHFRGADNRMDYLAGELCILLHITHAVADHTVF